MSNEKDTIYRQDAIDMLAAMQGRCTSKAALIQNSKIWQQIKDLPSAQPERKQGFYYWDEEEDRCYCSNCEAEAYLDECSGTYETFDFCPYCGADMRGVINGNQ